MSVVLLVGGAGYAGSVLAAELLEQGYAVRILDRLYFGEQGLADIRDRVELVVGDVRTMPLDVLDDVEIVVNVGGISNDPTAEFNPRANHDINTTASVALARLCHEHGVRRYVYASSCSIYDRGVLDEAMDVVADETSPVDPPGAYARSKLAAERQLLPMASAEFCVSILRHGTLFGFSRRMRYDLVVNTFVKDALYRGRIVLHAGGEMWRPLTDVRDAARACLTLLRADPGRVTGQVYNVVHRNFRISELAMRVRGALMEMAVPVEIEADYGHRGIRNYRVSNRKLLAELKVQPGLTVEDSVRHMVASIRRHGYEDYENPIYYNIVWMRLLEQAHSVIRITGGVFEPPAAGGVLRVQPP
jgi:nucleoside-diphosphate-sugar epimerase